MVKIENRDITEVERGILVHGVNCQGAMGSGVALAIKNKWPIVYHSYLIKNRIPNLNLLGDVQIVPVEPEVYVVNGWTQQYFGSDGRKYADIDAVQQVLYKSCQLSQMMMLPLYCPVIGCGLGGLDWDTEVYPILQQLNISFNIPITVCII